MTATEPLRSEMIERRNQLLIGLATSLVVHLFFFGLWLVFGIAVAAHLVAEKLNQAQSAQRSQESSMVFIEVMPEQTSPEPPKETKFYSSANAKAANPDPQIDTAAP